LIAGLKFKLVAGDFRLGPAHRARRISRGIVVQLPTRIS
jgi:hypothetical protein